jgi:hypothetical protein
MRNKGVHLVLAACLLTAGPCFAGRLFNPHMGKWRLNPAKSSPGIDMMRKDLVHYEWSFFKIKITVSSVDGHGHRVHSEWIGNFDGQDYPVTGDPMLDTRSYRIVNDNTLDFTSKKGRQVITTGRIVVSPDGNTRTVVVTTWPGGLKGKPITGVAVYDKVKLFDKME